MYVMPEDSLWGSVLLSHHVPPAWGIELGSSDWSFKSFSLLGHLAMWSWELGSDPALVLFSYGQVMPAC